MENKKNSFFKKLLLTEQYIRPFKSKEFGFVAWYNKYGDLHRGNDLPAIIYQNGRKEWHYNGAIHRKGKKPAVITEFGNKAYYNNGTMTLFLEKK